jgi:hypothetical protein
MRLCDKLASLKPVLINVQKKNHITSANPSTNIFLYLHLIPKNRDKAYL